MRIYLCTAFEFLLPSCLIYGSEKPKVVAWVAAMHFVEQCLQGTGQHLVDVPFLLNCDRYLVKFVMQLIVILHIQLLD
jgi:hypothetical protein